MSVSYEDLPSWMQDNNYLLERHRPQMNSFLECFRSIFQLHTETVNIWTHLVGFIMFIMLATLYLIKPSSLEEKLALSPFFLGAILCLGFSFIYHTVSCHSPNVEKLFQHLDFCGITLLILGSLVPWIYFGFYCHPWLTIIYLCFVTTLGSGAFIVSLLERFGKPEFRAVRSCVFTGFGLSSIIPGVHILVLQGWTKAVSLGAPLVIMAFFYIAGSTLYAVRVPERISPGRFDVWFHSHQIFHVLVVVATLTDYLGLMSLIRYDYHNCAIK